MKTHPVVGSHESSVQGLLSPQTTGTAVHWPSKHWSNFVQALLSSQGLVLGEATQPATGSQESSVQTLPSSQVTGAPGAHTPPEQWSFTVQTLPSEHEDPSGLGECVHPS